MADVQVAGSEAPPRVQTCALCGELFDSVRSLDAHLVAGKCRDPFLMIRDQAGVYVFDALVGVAENRTVWSLAKEDR